MEPSRIDPYATLGVRRDATAAQIAQAYYRLAKELHPDLRGEATVSRMRDVNAAWEILSDPQARRVGRRPPGRRSRCPLDARYASDVDPAQGRMAC